tara:strand:- start:176 stop:553 length:378 start_codon:yes stop_codon:yes gene_type:complete
MNELIAGIYGTNGMDKTASENEAGIHTLSDLALALVVESEGDTEDIEKVASVHEGLLDHMVSFDRAGRAMAHSEFAEMEKQASEGSPEAIHEFFSDVSDEEVAESDVDTAALREALVAELQRRNA